jgi:hypothetical protein
MRLDEQIKNEVVIEDIQQSFRTVDEDHALLLGQMKALEDAISLLREDDRDDSHVLPVLAQLRHYFLSDLLPHLLREETEFLPVVTRLVANGTSKAARVRDEHGQLRRRIEQFRTAYTLVSYVGPQARHELLWRLIHEARAIFAQLKIHAAFEFELTRELARAAGGLTRRATKNGNNSSSAA